MPATSPVRLLEHLDRVALALAVAQVHAQQHRRPVLRLGAAAARLDVDEAGARVHRMVEHPPELELADRLLEVGDVVAQRVQRRVVVLGARELEQLVDVGRGRASSVVSVPTTPSSAFFSLPSACARSGSSQIFGSSSSRATSASRSDFTSKSKIPPQLALSRSRSPASVLAIWLICSASIVDPRFLSSKRRIIRRPPRRSCWLRRSGRRTATGNRGTMTYHRALAARSGAPHLRSISSCPPCSSTGARRHRRERARRHAAAVDPARLPVD